MGEKKTFMLYYDWFGNLEFIYREREREIYIYIERERERVHQ